MRTEREVPDTECEGTHTYHETERVSEQTSPEKEDAEGISPGMDFERQISRKKTPGIASEGQVSQRTSLEKTSFEDNQCSVGGDDEARARRDFGHGRGTDIGIDDDAGCEGKLQSEWTNWQRTMCLVPAVKNSTSSRRRQERPQKIAPPEEEGEEGYYCSKQTGGNLTRNPCLDNSELRVANKHCQQKCGILTGNTSYVADNELQAASKCGDSASEEGEAEAGNTRKFDQVAGNALSVEVLSPAFGDVFTGGACTGP